MLFTFNGLRTFQLIIALLALFAGAGWAAIIATAAVTGLPILLVPLVLAGVIFGWLALTAFQLTTSFVEVSETATRVRFGGHINATIPHADIISAHVAEPTNNKFGVRMNLRGTAAFTTSTGPFCELELARPVRAWLIPRLLPVKVRTLRLGVADPEKLAERLSFPGRNLAAASPETLSARTMKEQRPG